jgi:hypothetical protein
MRYLFNSGVVIVHQIGNGEYGIVYGTLENGDEYTHNDAYYQYYVEGLSPERIGPENNGIKLFL